MQFAAGFEGIEERIGDVRGEPPAGKQNAETDPAEAADEKAACHLETRHLEIAIEADVAKIVEQYFRYSQRTADKERVEQSAAAELPHHDDDRDDRHLTEHDTATVSALGLALRLRLIDFGVVGFGGHDAGTVRSAPTWRSRSAQIAS